jgi:putative nucleotidyltransferase with HDIG domain
VADLSATIAAEMSLPDDEIENIRLAGRLHDIGKIGTREDVQNKHGPLTPEEYDHIKQHVVIGSQILSPLQHLGPIIDVVRSHHERWDGTGYPDGRRADEIPLAARIIGAAEVWDAPQHFAPLSGEAHGGTGRAPDGRAVRLGHRPRSVRRPVGGGEAAPFLDVPDRRGRDPSRNARVGSREHLMKTPWHIDCRY